MDRPIFNFGENHASNVVKPVAKSREGYIIHLPATWPSWSMMKHKLFRNLDSSWLNVLDRVGTKRKQKRSKIVTMSFSLSSLHLQTMTKVVYVK